MQAAKKKKKNALKEIKNGLQRSPTSLCQIASLYWSQREIQIPVAGFLATLMKTRKKYYFNLKVKQN